MVSVERSRFPDSSAVAAIAYHERRRWLDVTFTSGAVYRYRDVPAAVFRRFRDADSAGRFLNAEILDRYEFKRLS